MFLFAPIVTELFTLLPKVVLLAPKAELPNAEVFPRPELLKADPPIVGAALKGVKAACCWPRDWTGGP